MAYRVGLVGPENTGKSFSRSFIKNPNEIFVIMPSQKALHFLIDGKHPPKLNFAKGADKTTRELMGRMNVPYVEQLVQSTADIYQQGKTIPGLEVSGNYALVQDLRSVNHYLKIVDLLMPEKKFAIIPDMTHYVSNIIGMHEFITRKEGGEAYQRFWELAADILNNFFNNVDSLREDLLVVIEYHSEYDVMEDTFKIFMPGGKMVIEKFRAMSYYDTLLYTHYERDDKLPYADRFKFVTQKWQKYDGRSLPGCFESVLIPNNLQVVGDTMRKKLGLIS